MLMVNQHGGVFRQNNGRGSDLRVYTDRDPDNMTAYFEEYLGKLSGIIPRRSDFLYSVSSGLDRLIPEFIHITQIIDDPGNIHSTLERNPFSIAFNDFYRAKFTEREIQNLNHPKDGKLRCRLLQDRGGVEYTDWTFNNYPIKKKNVLRLLESWLSVVENRSRLSSLFPKDETITGMAKGILLWMKYAIIIFNAEKELLIKMERDGLVGNKDGFSQTLEKYKRSLYNFKVEWFDDDYKKSNEYLEWLKDGPPPTKEMVEEIRTRWRDDSLASPYAMEKHNIEKRWRR